MKKTAKHFLAQHSRFDLSSPDVRQGLLWKRVCCALQLRDKPSSWTQSHWGNHIRFTVRISAGPHSFSSLILRHVSRRWTKTPRQKCAQIFCFKRENNTGSHSLLFLDKCKHRLGFNYPLQWFVIRSHYQVKQHCLPWLIKLSRWVLNITLLLCKGY